jgi:hypothetical protein
MISASSRPRNAWHGLTGFRLKELRGFLSRVPSNGQKLRKLPFSDFGSRTRFSLCCSYSMAFRVVTPFLESKIRGEHLRFGPLALRHRRPQLRLRPIPRPESEFRPTERESYTESKLRPNPCIRSVSKGLAFMLPRRNGSSGRRRDAKAEGFLRHLGNVKSCLILRSHLSLWPQGRFGGTLQRELHTPFDPISRRL